MSVAAVRARVLAVCEPVVAAGGAELEALEVSVAGRRRLVRLVVDRDAGLQLDDVAEISRAVSEALDGSDAMGGSPYVLEVTSPGVDRPLTEPRHWRRNAGRVVRAVLRDGGECTGRVLRLDGDLDGDTVVLDTAGGARALPLGSVARGEVQVEFSRREPTSGAGPDDTDDTDETDETDETEDDSTDGPEEG